MTAYIIKIQGNLKPVALRHHILELGKLHGIQGFLNYRQGIFELYIYAEGKEEIMIEFTRQVKQLAKQHKLVYFIEPAEFKDCQNFKILPLPNDASDNSMHSTDKLNTDLIQSKSAEAPPTDMQPIPSKTKNHMPGIRKTILSYKKVGFW